MWVIELCLLQVFRKKDSWFIILWLALCGSLVWGYLESSQLWFQKFCFCNSSYSWVSFCSWFEVFRCTLLKFNFSYVSMCDMSHCVFDIRLIALVPIISEGSCYFILCCSCLFSVYTDERVVICMTVLFISGSSWILLCQYWWDWGFYGVCVCVCAHC